MRDEQIAQQEINQPGDDLVDAQFACPGCDERHADQLLWQDDEMVLCGKCGMVFVA